MVKWKWGIVFVVNNQELNVQPHEQFSSKQIEELPPSAKLVFKVLEYSGLLTQKEIVRESYLPPRTVRYALSRLKDEGFLEERFYFKDARQSLYGIRDGMSATPTVPVEVMAIWTPPCARITGTHTIFICPKTNTFSVQFPEGIPGLNESHWSLMILPYSSPYWK